MSTKTQFYAVEKDGQYVNSSGGTASTPDLAMTTSDKGYANEVADRTGGKVTKV